MKAMIALILILLASPALAFQGMGPGPGVKGYTGGGGATTWGPTQIALAENDAASVANPLDATGANQCLDGDGSSIGGGGDIPLGLRWVTTIPQGATITDSELKVYIGYPDSGSPTVTMRVYGHDVASSPALNTSDGLTVRARTTAYADFSITGAEGYATLNSAALDDVIEEIASNTSFDGTITLLLIDQNGAGDSTEMQINTRCSTTMNADYYSSLEVTYE